MSTKPSVDPNKWAKQRQERIEKARLMREERKKAKEDEERRKAIEEEEYQAARRRGYAAVHVSMDQPAAASNRRPVGGRRKVQPSTGAQPIATPIHRASSEAPRDEKKGAAAAAGSKGSKKSVVSAIEQIAKRREERRRRQQEEQQAKQEELKRHGDVENLEYRKQIRAFREQMAKEVPKKSKRIIPVVQDDRKVFVCVRKRPINQAETTRKCFDVLTCLSRSKLIVHEPKLRVDLQRGIENHEFVFDRVFDEEDQSSLLYKEILSPLLPSLIQGSSFAVFAYGQTGSGKTFTMNAIYERTIHELFNIVNKQEEEVVCISYFEIYMSKVFDLLAERKQLPVREDEKQRVQVVGLVEHPTRDPHTALSLLAAGQQSRRTGSTQANADSSRSHAILHLSLKSKSTGKIRSRATLVDLAGSERGSEAEGDKTTILEGAEINKSLLSLKECIRAMDAKSSHIPFRASKLTHILRDCFVGKDARTIMIATVSPPSSACEHTLNTLRYAGHLKDVSCRETAGPAGGGTNAASALPSPITFSPPDKRKKGRGSTMGRGGESPASPVRASLEQIKQSGLSTVADIIAKDKSLDTPVVPQGRNGGRQPLTGRRVPRAAATATAPTANVTPAKQASPILAGRRAPTASPAEPMDLSTPKDPTPSRSAATGSGTTKTDSSGKRSKPKAPKRTTAATDQSTAETRQKQIRPRRSKAPAGGRSPSQQSSDSASVASSATPLSRSEQPGASKAAPRVRSSGIARAVPPRLATGAVQRSRPSPSAGSAASTPGDREFMAELDAIVNEALDDPSPSEHVAKWAKPVSPPGWRQGRGTASPRGDEADSASSPSRRRWSQRSVNRTFYGREEEPSTDTWSSSEEQQALPRPQYRPVVVGDSRTPARGRAPPTTKDAGTRRSPQGASNSDHSVQYPSDGEIEHYIAQANENTVLPPQGHDPISTITPLLEAHTAILRENVEKMQVLQDFVAQRNKEAEAGLQQQGKSTAAASEGRRREGAGIREGGTVRGRPRETPKGSGTRASKSKSKESKAKEETRIPTPPQHPNTKRLSPGAPQAAVAAVGAGAPPMAEGYTDELIRFLDAQINALTSLRSQALKEKQSVGGRGGHSPASHSPHSDRPDSGGSSRASSPALASAGRLVSGLGR